MDDLSLISIVKEFGFAAIAFLLMYVLIKQMQNRMLTQCDETLNFAKNIVSANTEALTKMYNALEMHMKQKDEWMEKMKDCATVRDEKLKEIEERMEKWSENRRHRE